MIRSVVRILLAAAVFAALPSVASAQAKQGDKELLLFGNLSTVRSDGSTQSTGLIFVNFGAYVSDVLQIGGGPTFIISGGDGGTRTVVGANAFVRRSFTGSNPKVAPFVGAEVQIADFDPDFGGIGDNTFLQAIAGVKNYISERAALDFKGFFGFVASDPGAQQQFGFTVGLTVIF